MSIIEAKSIENWPRYQLKYEFVSFPNTHWHACQVFWLISQSIINGFGFKIVYLEGMNMAPLHFTLFFIDLTATAASYPASLATCSIVLRARRDRSTRELGP